MDQLPVRPAFEQLVLHTNRLVLRPLIDSDANDLLAIYGDPQVMRYLSRPPWTTLDDALASIAQDHAALQRTEHLRLGITLQPQGRVIGTCVLFNLVWPSRRAELGYCLAADAWGHGYASEALVRFLGHAFSTLHLNRLEADIDPHNGASRRVLERLGFQREGLLRERWIVAGEVSDTALYGLLCSEWQHGDA